MARIAFTTDSSSRTVDVLVQCGNAFGHDNAFRTASCVEGSLASSRTTATRASRADASSDTSFFAVYEIGENLVDVLLSLAVDMGAHRAFGCEIDRFLEVAPRTDNGAAHRDAIKRGGDDRQGKVAGRNALSDTVPPRRTMPNACTNALRDTAVTTVPCMPPISSE
jgi:hypothetical protein